MGIHTGEPVLTAEGYVGIDVHRAARIAAAGHGGQVLVSESTKVLAGADGLQVSENTSSKIWLLLSASTSLAQARFPR